MTNLDLLIYATTIAVFLAIIGIIGVLYDLYFDSIRSLWTSYMDRSHESLGRRIEELDDEDWDVVVPDPNDLPPICGTYEVTELEKEMKRMRNAQEAQKAASIEPEWTDEGLKVTVTQHDGSETVIKYDEETTKEIEEDFGMDFLSDKFKEGDKKVANGEISCNLDNPEDCINCGS